MAIIKIVYALIEVASILGVIFIVMYMRHLEGEMANKMLEKGLIDKHEAFWHSAFNTADIGIQDYLHDDDLARIYRRYTFLWKLVFALIGGAVVLGILGGLIGLSD